MIERSPPSSPKYPDRHWPLLLDALPAALLVHTGTAVVYANPSAAAALGATRPADLLGRDPEALLAGHRAVGACPATVDWAGRPASVIVLGKGRAEGRVLERQLRRAQKLDSLATLAGGLAHQINNMLVPILTLTQYALAEFPEGSRGRTNLAQVLRSAGRAVELVRQILAFGAREAAHREVVPARALVEQAVEASRPMVPATIRLATALDDAGRVLADPGQFRQALRNLLSNAVHAIGAGPGEIAVALGPYGCERPTRLRNRTLPPGSFAVVSVRDSGCGMPEPVMQRIFEPFYTTRDVGEGSGLGLSVVHGVILAHDGAVDVESTPGHGATFRIYLPVSGEA